jgi:hypothetical protein
VNQHEEGNQPEDLVGEIQPGEFAELEKELRRMLQRVDAPEGFAERTMARARGGGASRGKLLLMPSRLRAWGSGAIAAALVAGILMGEQAHVRHERAAEAQRQFEAGMQITDAALEHTRQQLRRAGVQVGD